MSSWQERHDQVALYVYEHPGCTKSDIIRELQLSEKQYEEHRERLSGHMMIYEYPGWHPTDFLKKRGITDIRRRAWKRELKQASEELLAEARNEAVTAAALVEAAERYRGIALSDPGQYKPNRPSRIQLLVEDV